MGITDDLRHALKDDGRRLEDLAKDAGTYPANLSRFATGKKTIVLDTAEKLAEALGGKIEFVKPKRKRNSKPAK